MGQREGGVSLDDGAYGVSYGCASLYSDVSLFANGVHVTAGESQILVDGEEVASGSTTYNSGWDTTTFALSVKMEYGDTQKAAPNALLSAIDAGREVVWITPTGAEFTVPLKGSADIRNCRMGG